MTLDSHRHFWHYNDEEFGWIADECLRRDFLPENCAGMDPCIAVEARQSVEETEWLISLADAKPDLIRGIVGWLPIAAPDFPAVLERFEGEKRLVALRHVVQDEIDDAFILRPDFVRGVKHLLSRGYAYDILVFERHLENVMKFVDSLPDDARLVLDHLGKPHDFASWRRKLKELSRREKLYCKVSGLVTEVGDASRAALEPYIAAALEAFGEERLMFGSDWPVVTAHMSYQEWRETLKSCGAGESVMGAVAAEFYAVENRFRP